MAWSLSRGTTRPADGRRAPSRRRSATSRVSRSRVTPPGQDQRAESSAALLSRRRRAQRTFPWNKLWPALSAVLVTLGGYLVNVQGKSPLDLLPLAWTWLTVWLALSVGLELLTRWRAGQPSPRRDRRGRSRQDDTF